MTAVARRRLDRVWLAICLEVWTMGVCPVWEQVQLVIGALILGDGCLGTFGILKLDWTPSTLRGGVWVVEVTLGDY